jgi:carboxyl-terminal processing protease
LKSQRSSNKPRGEGALRGHLENAGECGGKDGTSGSSAYIPEDSKSDKQLVYALDLLRGTKVNENFPPNTKTAVPN